MDKAAFDILVRREATMKDDTLMRIGGDRTAMRECSAAYFRPTLEYVCAKQKGEGEVIITVPKPGIAVLVRIATLTLRLLLDNQQESDILDGVNKFINVLNEEAGLHGTFSQGGTN